MAIWIGAPENRVYGNSAILNHFSGVSNRSIRGRLQHGWPAHSPHDLYYKNDLLPTFVWSKESEIAAKNFGWHNFSSIGAPWLYLLQILEGDGWRTSQMEKNSLVDKSLWVYGRHAVESYSSVNEQLLVFLERANLEATPGDICLLYFEDFDSLSFIEMARFKNLQIVTLGQRSSSFISDSHLVRLFHLLKSVSQVIIDHPSSLVLYALTMDIRISWLRNTNWQKAIAVAKENGDINLENFLVSSTADSLKFKPYALAKLGKSSMKSGHELKKILMWDNSSRTKLHLFWIYSKTLFFFPIKFFRLSSTFFSKQI
jgi:hypothetical protein